MELALQINDPALSSQCAAWLEGQQQAKAAARLYAAAGQFDRAAELYLGCREFAAVDGIITQTSSPAVKLRYAEAKEGELALSPSPPTVPVRRHGQPALLLTVMPHGGHRMMLCNAWLAQGPAHSVVPKEPSLPWLSGLAQSNIRLTQIRPTHLSHPLCLQTWAALLRALPPTSRQATPCKPCGCCCSGWGTCRRRCRPLGAAQKVGAAIS